MKRLTVIALIASIGVAIPNAQNQTEKPFTTEVSFVRVDMYATRDGTPVTDLQQSEVELLEDDVPQTIQQFEHVSISGPRSQTTRREISTVDEMKRATLDPRARVVVLFLDPRFVDVLGSMQVRRPLIDTLNRLIGGDDLVAVMTPYASVQQLTFRRRTDSIEAMLEEYWGEKGWPGIRDPVEFQYEACYGSPDPRLNSISAQMIARRREVLTLDALEALTGYLRTLREERKAVITISDGWPLYGPDRTLARPLTEPGGQREIPIPKIGTVPGTGRPGLRDPSATVVSNSGIDTLDRSKCETDRLALSELNNTRRFITMMQSANRANVSFYPVDPKRLFLDAPTLRGNRALEMMAEMTDGMLISQADALESGLRRIVDDLSSYYLLGYNTTAKPDGQFHRITIRVKRPGVEVRGRAGYLAPTAEEARRPETRLSSVDTAETEMMSRALGALTTLGRGRIVRIQTAAGWKPSGTAGVWVVAEISRDGDDRAWDGGGEIELSLTDPSRTTVASEEMTLKPTPSGLSVRVAFAPKYPLDEGDYQVQVRARAPGALGANETVRFSLPAAPLGSGALLYRRSLSTGNRDVPTADLRFRRTERMIAEMPTTSQTPPTARLLGRTGTALNVPVTASLREEADGGRWQRVEVALAPLAPGDYLIESSSGNQRTFVAFRLIP